MEKTPNRVKKMKTSKTPSTAPKRLASTPQTDSEAVPVARRSVRRTKLDMDSDASPKVPTFFTPSRTTRSMLKVTSNDPLPSYVTPIKSMQRKTIASARATVVGSDDVKLDGAFVRPLPPKTKKIDKTQSDNSVVADETLIDENLVGSSGRKRTRKMANMSNISIEADDIKEKRTSRKSKRVKLVETESEDDLPSVSMLVTNQSPAGQFVRLRKTMQSAIESSDDDLASVSQLGMNTSGQFLRSRRTNQSFADNVVSSEDDLPSVSILGATGATPVAKVAPLRKSKRSIEPTKENEMVPTTIAAKPTPNKRTSTRKSNQATPPEQQRMSGQFVRSRKSINSGEAAIAEVPTESTDSKEKSAIAHVELIVASSSDQGDQNQVNVHEIPAIEVTAVNSNESIGSDVVSDLPAIGIEKKLKVNRISVIDLTDSPVVQTKAALDETFSPEKVEKEADDAEVMNRTFTDETNTTTVNDKTFSPVPTSNKKVVKKVEIASVPRKGRVSLNVSSKSSAKKKSPQLKRLQQSTPYLKLKPGNHTTANSSKMSSAKKAKVTEAAKELLDSKTVNSLKVPKVTVESPKLFKFGEDKQPAFRFSLVAPHLKDPGKFLCFLLCFAQM